MNQLIQSGPAAFWFIVFFLLIFLVIFGTMFLVTYRKLRQGITVDVFEQAERLRGSMEPLFRSIKSAQEIVELELITDHKLVELNMHLESAVRNNDYEKTRKMELEIENIHLLQKELRQAFKHREATEIKIRNVVFNQTPQLGANAVSLLTGQILIIRHDGKYGAIQAIDQASEERGSFIRYAWWYQSDGTCVFTNSTTQLGFGQTGEGQGCQLELGPIKLSWSKCDDGAGWIYFGPTIVPSADYELAYSNQTDISRVDTASYTFMKPLEEA